MGEYQFTVQQEGYIFVQADSIEEAEKILKDRINHFYVVTDSGEQPADDSWELTGDVEIVTEDHY
tara:strand:- start:120 stop:314 length:195 start_codon:yes stop_codon:yes gene_type:complete